MHQQLGHAIAPQMKPILCDGREWRQQQQNTTDNMTSIASAPYRSVQIHDLSAPPTARNRKSRNLLYWCGIFQYVAVHSFHELQNEEANDTQSTDASSQRPSQCLENILFNRNGIPNIVCWDQIFNKAEIINFCTYLIIEFHAVSANPHKRNAKVKCANRSVRFHIMRFSPPEGRKTIENLVFDATFHVNLFQCHHNASEFELKRNRASKLSIVCNPNSQRKF